MFMGPRRTVKRMMVESLNQGNCAEVNLASRQLSGWADKLRLLAEKLIIFLCKRSRYGIGKKKVRMTKMIKVQQYRAG